MNKKTRIINLILFLVGLLLLNYFVYDKLFFTSGDQSLWIHSGLLMLIFGLFWIENFFTKPADVVINSLVVFISASSLNSPPYFEYWEYLKYYSLILAILAFLIIWVGTPAFPEYDTSKFKKFIYSIITRLGSAQVIYSIVFLLAFLSFIDVKSFDSKIILLFWTILIIWKYLDFEGFLNLIFSYGKNKQFKPIGKILKYNHPNIVSFQLFDDNKCNKGSLVAFTEKGIIEKDSPIGVVIGQNISTDTCILDSLLIDSAFELGTIDKRSIVIKIDELETEIKNRLENNNNFKNLDRLIGFASQYTDISALNFELIKRPNIEEGHLVGVKIKDDTNLLFQVINGKLYEENIIDATQRSFTLGNAEQIGTWNDTTQGFEVFGWVVPENSPVFHITKDLDVNIVKKENILDVGIIPNSNLPVNVNIQDLVLYHSAILGVTGSGKSFLAYELIEQCAKSGIKVICLDVTGDYKRYIRNPVLLNKKGAVEEFLNSKDHNIGIAEFMDKAIHPINATHHISNIAINWCEANRKKEEIKKPVPKVLLVLEEAHTLVPEWNSNPERNLQDVVNKTSKITLQARKYGLGFMVITQRTANVTKSILNQCNTIFAFQAYDETGFEFMKNYMGEHYVHSLPNLKKRQGIIVGKASVSDRPIITRFYDQERNTTDVEIPEIQISKKVAE